MLKSEKDFFGKMGAEWCDTDTSDLRKLIGPNKDVFCHGASLQHNGNKSMSLWPAYHPSIFYQRFSPHQEKLNLEIKSWCTNNQMKILLK